MRRFLFVVHYPVFGGPHNQGVDIAAPLAEHGWSMVFLLPDEPGNAVARVRAAGVDVVTIRLHRLRATRDIRTHWALATGFVPDVQRIREVIRRKDVDVVVICGLINPQAAIAARLERIPLVWQIVDTRLPMLVRRAMIPLVKRLADVAMTTGTTVADLHPGLTDIAERVVPYYCPVDTDRFSPDPIRRSAARAELGIPDDAVVIGNIGNLNPMKGHPLFVRAAALVKRAFPNVRFLILGERHDTHRSYADDLLRQAESLGLVVGRDLMVIAPGNRVVDLANALDIFWLTSEPLSEGVPTVVEEAMALAKPVIATDVGGVREIVEEGKTGSVVPPLDAQALAAASMPLVRDPDLRAKLGAAGRAIAVARCDTRICVQRHLEAFHLATTRRFDQPVEA